MSSVTASYPWTASPLIASAPMRLISGPPLAYEVSSAGGFGFLAAGVDVSGLAQNLADFKSLLAAAPIPSSKPDILPVGVGFILWGADLSLTVKVLSKPGNAPAAVWLFAPESPAQLKSWAEGIRKATNGKTKIWVQISSVADATEAVAVAGADLLVIQGADAGGHGRYKSAGLISLVPEVIDTVTAYCSENGLQVPGFIAAGGIADSRGVNAVVALGAHGAAMGSRYLASSEANIAKGYQDAVLRASDGGVSTTRTDVYDKLRGTTGWPKGYGGRGVTNKSYEDALSGVAFEENQKAYKTAEAMGNTGWEGAGARMTTYVGTGVGLVKSVIGAKEITRSARGESKV
ncbi:hypothetical protein H072_8776 [Dactylellina haptotyla CBS 200.50]|uniref:Uncharacterized protein n=1 Tax=Dactylellina haptotyla (strain CBS 200.50) TaxID=1284197 RepID=S8BE59_DACHA|nr:hypothetical protein H072_8776 [Dactylellina haptotyla CBS 200.50]